MSTPTLLWAPQAWLRGGWCADVLLHIGADGHWAEVQAGVAPPAQAERLAGAVLPGLVNAHSHAFQRAFAGLSERRDDEQDDFWSWRDRMYRVASRISPDQLRAVAAQLYAELLRGGYTQVCEFHYLQHRPDGRRYDDAAQMCWSLADAAAEAGIGLTLLPVLYQRAGFDRPNLRDDQRRFATDVNAVLDLQRTLRHSGRAGLSAGVAVHSLRAAEPAAINALAERAGDGPVHIHIAEQTAEVDACLAAHGMRPIEWLSAHAAPDARWQLVHATHATRAEIEAVARCGAGVVLCPSTEANLGDGLADLPGWLDAGVPLAIGSDSHATRAWREELRWLEYGQRLLLRQRNIAAAPAAGQPSTAARLWSCVADGGGRAAGFARWGLQAGARADLLVIDGEDASLLGVPASQLLDALVFSSPGRPFRDVLVAGRWAVREHRQAAAAGIGTRFTAAMHELWAEP